MRSASLTVCVFVAAAIGTGLAARQTPPPNPPQTPPNQTPPIFRGRTDIVQLDVSVLDKRRRPVRGLTAADFTVLEDGQPQELVAVSEIALPDEYAKPPVWAKAAPPDVSSNDVGDKRLFAIVVDAWVQATRANTPSPAGVLTRRPNPGLVDAVSDVVHGILNRLGPRDMAAILGTVCNQAFTDDREKLSAAIDSIRPGAAPCHSNFGRATPGVPRPPHLLILDLAEYLSVVPQRRKAIIYIGRGYMVNGRNSRVEYDVFDALWLAQQSNVNIYAISPYAMGVGGIRTGRSTLDSLKLLSEETGGFAITDPDKYEAGLDQLFSENGSYYLLGYKTTHPAMDGKFRKLSVKVAGHPDVTVRTRTMWYRPKQARTAGPTAAAVPSAATVPRLSGLLPNLDVTFEAVAMPFARPGEARPGVALVTEITEPVSRGVARVTQQMDLRTLVYDETGELRRDVTLRAGLDQPPTTDESIRYGVVSNFDLAPGRYRVRLTAHNAGNDKIGSTEFDLLVPDFSREAVSLSGIALTTTTAAPAVSFGTLAPLVSVAPTALRAFTTGDAVSASLRVYQGGTSPIAPVTLTVHLLDAAGTAIFDVTAPLAADRFDAARAADYRLELPMDRLKGGPYLLTFEAALGSRRTPKRDVRFTIR